MEYHTLSAVQQGALGEALISGHGRKAAEEVDAWISADLRANEGVGREDSIRVHADHRVETYYVNHEGEHISWTPDCLFTARVAKGFGALQSSNERRIDFPAEVKTGTYAELERNQSQVMRLISAQDGLVPIRIQVAIDRLPDEYGISIRRLER